MKGAFTVGLKFASIHLYDPNKKMTSDQFSQVFWINYMIQKRSIKKGFG